MKKLWGIRHIRYFYLTLKLSMWISHCQRLGLGFFAQESDIEYLNDVWIGKK